MKTSKSDINLLRNIIESNGSKPIDIITTRSSIITRMDYDHKQNIDMNYSVYSDNLSLSNSPDNMINKIYPKRNDKWVDSNLIYKCQNCEKSFGILIRKHHCRACGGVFCSSCCNKYIEIPKNIIKIPEQDTTIKINIKNTFDWMYGNTQKLVCVNCNKKIDDLKKVENLIKIFEYVDLPTLYNLKFVCKNYQIAAIHILSKFRDIQYGLYNKEYTQWEKNILFDSKEYLINHSVWFTNLIKSIIEYTFITKTNVRIVWLENTLKLLLNDKYILKIQNIKCFTLMCSRKCKKSIDFDDIIEIFEYIQYSIKKDETILELDKIKNIIILLSKILFNKTYHKIHNIIPLLCYYYNNLFEYEMINLDSNFIMNLFDIIFSNKYLLKKIKSLIIYEKYYYDNLNNLSNNMSNNNLFFKYILKYITDKFGTKLLNDITKMNISINNIINDKISNIDIPFIYPFDPIYQVIKINNISQFKSNTKPILVDVDIKNLENNSIKKVKFIIKKNNGLRKEQMISCLIDILQYKISEHYQEIPTYQIIMLTKELALLEYIDDAVTLRSINEKGYTLQNYILNKNINNKLDTIKTKFVHSLAISSALAYIIGIGDRHLDNIMINSNGLIFHVDYGYIMENPTIIFNLPEIKVTDEIIDFLGGPNSLYYCEFKKIIVQIYNECRANKNILYIYFKFICDEGFLDWNTVYNKLDSKLMTGMKCKDVELSLINEIESSNTYMGIISDMCHNYKQKFFS